METLKGDGRLVLEPREGAKVTEDFWCVGGRDSTGPLKLHAVITRGYLRIMILLAVALPPVLGCTSILLSLASLTPLRD